MSLTAGNYTIRSALDFGLFVGRDPLGRDERIQARPNNNPPGLWQIERADEPGRFYLKTDGLSTTTFNNVVYTTVNPPGEGWKVERVPQHGLNEYIIIGLDGFSGWVLSNNEPFTPVAVQPLTATDSIPPQYPANERWVFDRLTNLD